MFRRVGGSAVLKFDARILVASRKDLWAEVLAGRFREDLYFRLSVFTLGLPPLRERKEDIPLLVDNFAGREMWSTLPDSVRELFQAHGWPGNLRELRNAVQRANHLLSSPGSLTPQTLLQADSPTSAGMGSGEALSVSYAGTFRESKEALLAAFEREYLHRLITRNGGQRRKSGPRSRHRPQAPAFAPEEARFGLRRGQLLGHPGFLGLLTSSGAPRECFAGPPDSHETRHQCSGPPRNILGRLTSALGIAVKHAGRLTSMMRRALDVPRSASNVRGSAC